MPGSIVALKEEMTGGTSGRRGAQNRHTGCVTSQDRLSGLLRAG